LDKAREMMKQMYSRRGRTWDEEDETQLKLAMESAKEVESRQ
jgi:hypothetical protein